MTGKRFNEPLCASKRSFDAAVDFTRDATVAHLSNEVLFSNTPDDCAESRLRRKCAIPDNRGELFPPPVSDRG